MMHKACGYISRPEATYRNKDSRDSAMEATHGSVRSGESRHSNHGSNSRYIIKVKHISSPGATYRNKDSSDSAVVATHGSARSGESRHSNYGSNSRHIIKMNQITLSHMSTLAELHISLR